MKPKPKYKGQMTLSPADRVCSNCNAWQGSRNADEHSVGMWWETLDDQPVCSYECGMEWHKAYDIKGEPVAFKWWEFYFAYSFKYPKEEKKWKKLMKEHKEEMRNKACCEVKTPT